MYCGEQAIRRQNMTEETIRIRRAEQEDLKAVSALYEEIHAAEERGDLEIGWERGVYPTGETAGGAFERGELFVLEYTGKTAGAAIINQMQVDVYADGKWNWNAPAEEVMVLHTLVISPDAAGKGLGSRFVKFYEEYAMNSGCRFLRMDTNIRNFAARSLYRKLGYTETDIVPCAFNGIQDVKLVLLEKTLPEKGTAAETDGIRITRIYSGKENRTEWDAYFTPEEAESVMAFHRSFPEYKETDLAALDAFASAHGVRRVFVKDESSRFGLNAFKSLGGSYSMAKYIGQRLGLTDADLREERLSEPDIAQSLGDLTFITATDGNHGRGIAWAAGRLGLRAKIFMPEGTVAERLQNILKLGAEACITDCNYDDTVRLAAETAEKYGWPLMQDTAWEGYETVPLWIMQGYLTMAMETVEQLHQTVPTHVFLQAGVGSMAGAVAAFFATYYGKRKPLIIIVEPHAADCIFRTAEAADGRLHKVSGSLRTIMAGLACGEPSSIAWDLINAYADYAVSMPEYIAANGMRILGNPLKNDSRIISGESGAAGFGLAAELLRDPNLENWRRELQINEDSVILCFSTEGDTDRENYRRIVWNGTCSGT